MRDGVGRVKNEKILVCGAEGVGLKILRVKLNPPPHYHLYIHPPFNLDHLHFPLERVASSSRH